MNINTIGSRAIVIGIRPENLGATGSQKASGVAQADMRPAFTVNQNMPSVGFPKGVRQSSSQAEDALEAQRQREEQYRKQNEEYQKQLEEEREREAAANKDSDRNYSDGTEDKMPNPDSGDPGGPRSLDPYLYQPQPLYINAIAKSMIR